MFLKSLKTDKEKEAFLELVYALIPLDDQFSDYEKMLIDEFKEEMNFYKEFKPFNIRGMDDINHLLEIFKNKDKNDLIGILIELVGLAKINLEYTEKEREFIRYVAKYWSIKDKLKDIEDWVDKYLITIKELNKIFHK